MNRETAKVDDHVIIAHVSAYGDRGRVISVDSIGKIEVALFKGETFVGWLEEAFHEGEDFPEQPITNKHRPRS